MSVYTDSIGIKEVTACILLFIMYALTTLISYVNITALQGYARNRSCGNSQQWSNMEHNELFDVYIKSMVSIHSQFFSGSTLGKHSAMTGWC